MAFEDSLSMIVVRAGSRNAYGKLPPGDRKCELHNIIGLAAWYSPPEPLSKFNHDHDKRQLLRGVATRHDLPTDP